MAEFWVTDYGASPGASDSTSAFQDAIDAAGVAAMSSGLQEVVRVPEDEFTISTRTGSGGLFWCLDMSWDNVTFYNEGNIICEPASAAVLFFVSGAAKKARAVTASIATWYEYWLWEFGGVQYTTQYNLATASTFERDATQITLAVAGDGANIDEGDWIGIRTGQTLAGKGLPDGELAEVTDVSGATITVADGLKCKYAREYFVSGTDGLTTTSVTANPAPYAVAVATDRLLYDVVIGGPGTIEQRTEDWVINGHQTIGFEISGLTAICNGYGLTSFGRSRHHTVRDCDVTIYDTNYAWWISADSTCTDFEWSDTIMRADAPTALHMNEGCGRINVRNVTMQTPSVAGDRLLAGCGSRGYDIDIDGCLFIGGGETTQIYVDTTNMGAGHLRGRVRNSQFENESGAVAFAVSPTDEGWVYEPYVASAPASVFAHAAGRVQ